MNMSRLSRTHENEQMQEQGLTQYDREARIVKTSEDQYERPDSSSSRSTVPEQPQPSPKVNVHNPSPLQQQHQQQVLRPDFNRVGSFFVIVPELSSAF